MNWPLIIIVLVILYECWAIPYYVHLTLHPEKADEAPADAGASLPLG